MPVERTSRVVFLSYASEDSSPAKRICEALRAAGLEVWFDQSELRGGDAWDRKIRRQLRDCAIFIPIISANTASRHEGYFRFEWDLADQRSHMIAHSRAFIVPVCVDATSEAGADTPDSFQRVQWTRLPGGEASGEFVQHIARLLSNEPITESAQGSDNRTAIGRIAPATRTPTRGRRAVAYGVIAVGVASVFASFALHRLIGPRSIRGTTSIAVLPFVNESGDASQQYFSDGLSENLITTLSHLAGLKVIGRTSAFRFRHSRDDSQTIGAKLGVAHLLEGSVQHAGGMVRVSAELVDTSDGSTQWSERYDRPYKDLFVLEDDLTRSVAEALKARLIPKVDDAEQQTDRPPSGNLEAYDAVLEGEYYLARATDTDTRTAIERFTRATQLDPHYAFAWSSLSRAWTELGAYHLDLATAPAVYAKARAADNTALSLAPDLPSALVARGWLLEWADFDWRGAEAQYRRALQLDPGNGDAREGLAGILAAFGQMNRATELIRQALVTDPLNSTEHSYLAIYLSARNRLDEAEAAIRRAIDLQPGGVFLHFALTNIEILRGDIKAAMVAAQQEPASSVFHDSAIAEALQSGNDRVAADAALEKLIGHGPSWDPYDVAEIYAMRQDPDRTFQWLNRAWSYHDPGLHRLLYDPFIGRYKDDRRFLPFCRKIGLCRL
jgi:TolB-like protein/Flp pilus assembly protein TadD